MDEQNNPTPEQEPEAPPTETPEGTTVNQAHALEQVMHGVILATILMVSSYLIGVTYWAVSYGTF